ncbi:hypothetical protein AGLY_013280 [Aphis glycines]|uniref:Uncharacterized protein n=1 Tax=Aphis glycines TaxID=307491 RepID=A0A6G0T760_APHGL|nr:hypothetical protein AGLY_013280 [Aphis glycines]
MDNINERKTNKRKNTVLSYFVKKVKEDKPFVNNESTELTSIEDSGNCDLQSRVSINIKESLNKQQYNKNDVGLFIERNWISDEDKHIILLNVWVPPSNYKFPLSEKTKTWLEVSSKTGCHIVNLKMMLFANIALFLQRLVEPIVSQPLGQPVVKSLNVWKNAKEIFRTHSQRSYHESSILDSDNFLKINFIKDLSINNRLYSERLKQIKSNRKRLVPIIDIV